jgi:hypothetical protein
VKLQTTVIPGTAHLEEGVRVEINLISNLLYMKLVCNEPLGQRFTLADMNTDQEIKNV